MNSLDKAKSEIELRALENTDTPTEKDQGMLEVVDCPQCKQPEYYGMMHQKSGKRLCRHCIYAIWRSDTWRPGKTAYTFPLYKDGIDYTNIK